MRLLSFLFLFSFFLLFPQEILGATFSITSPSAGSCFTPGQVVNITWGQTGAPASNHYAVTYNTSGTTPQSYTINSGAWVIGHNFGGVNETNISWTIPNISSTNVRVWVEAHKNNHDQTEIVSSGVFSIKSNCSSSPPPSPPPSSPPSAKPPSSSPPPSSPPTTSAPTTPTEALPPSIASDESKPQNDTTDDNSQTPNTKKDPQVEKKTLFQIPRWVGMLYLLMVGILSFGGVLFLLSQEKLKALLKSRFVKITPKIPRNLPKPVVSQPAVKRLEVVEKKIPKEVHIKDDLTIADLNNLRSQEELK